MALIKCSECGHEVSTHASACPNCGAPITPESPNADNISESKADNSQENKPNQTTKIVFVVLLAVVFLLGFAYTLRKASIADHSSSYSSGSTTRKVVIVGEKQSAPDTTTATAAATTSGDYKTAKSSDPNNAYVGVWKFTDKNNNEWVLTINGDETAEIHLKGSNSRAYASWYKYKHMRYASFQCSDKGPRIMFPGSELNSYENYQPRACGDFSVDGEYIYEDFSAADAKNPELRLPIKKVN